MRLDYRITYLLSIYKKEFGEQNLDTSASVTEVPVMAGERHFMTYSKHSFSDPSWGVYSCFKGLFVYVLIFPLCISEPNIEEIAEKAENMFSGRWGSDYA